MHLNYMKRKYTHFLILLFYIPLLIWFFYCENTVRPKYVMYCILDDFIPFVKFFIIPYLSWFPYIAFGFIYSGIVCRREYYRLCIFMFFGMTICYIIYMLFPNAQNLRPIIRDTDIFSKLISHIYSIDTPSNVSPSIHVLASIGINNAVIGCETERKNTVLQCISTIWMLLICMSTLFIKQHSVLDVMWGIILSAVLYIVMFGMEKCVFYLKALLTSSDVIH